MHAYNFVNVNVNVNVIYYPKKAKTTTTAPYSGKKSLSLHMLFIVPMNFSFIFPVSHRSRIGNMRSENLSPKVTSSPDNLWYVYIFFMRSLKSRNIFGGRANFVQSNKHKIARVKYFSYRCWVCVYVCVCLCAYVSGVAKVGNNRLCTRYHWLNVFFFFVFFGFGKSIFDHF